MEWTGHSDYKAMKPYIKIVDAAKVENMDKFNSYGEDENSVPEKYPFSALMFGTIGFKWYSRIYKT